MSHYFYHINESSEVNLKNKDTKHTVLEFLLRMTSCCKHMYSAIYDFMKSYLHMCETRKFVMAILHRKQGLLCDKTISGVVKMEKKKVY